MERYQRLLNIVRPAIIAPVTKLEPSIHEHRHTWMLGKYLLCHLRILRMTQFQIRIHRICEILFYYIFQNYQQSSGHSFQE